MARILIVDDHPDTAESLVLLVELLGHQARGALSGRDALVAVADFDPHVVLCDLNMPGLDGFAVGRAIRADETRSQVRLVAFSGVASAEQADAALDAGFEALWGKPIGFDRIEALVGMADTAVAR